MTGREKITLEKLVHRFDCFMAEDQRWKDNSDIWKNNIEEKINPLLQVKNDYEVIKKWWQTVFHIIVAILGIIISIGVIIHDIMPFFVKNNK